MAARSDDPKQQRPISKGGAKLGPDKDPLFDQFAGSTIIQPPPQPDGAPQAPTDEALPVITFGVATPPANHDLVIVSTDANFTPGDLQNFVEDELAPLEIAPEPFLSDFDHRTKLMSIKSGVTRPTLLAQVVSVSSSSDISNAEQLTNSLTKLFNQFVVEAKLFTEVLGRPPQFSLDPPAGHRIRRADPRGVDPRD